MDAINNQENEQTTKQTSVQGQAYKAFKRIDEHLKVIREISENLPEEARNRIGVFAFAGLKQKLDKVTAKIEAQGVVIGSETIIFKVLEDINEKNQNMSALFRRLAVGDILHSIFETLADTEDETSEEEQSGERVEAKQE